MAWIDVTDESEASGRLKTVYDEIAEARGKLSNIMRVHSLRPEAMRQHMALYKTLLFGRSSLPRADRELLAVVVSAVNDCAYCVRHHSEALNAYWRDRERVDEVIEDFRAVDLSEKQEAMLCYAVKLTRTPADVTEADVEALRQVGFADEDILDINLIASYFNFVNRIADGLGVEFTLEEVQGYRY